MELPSHEEVLAAVDSAGWLLEQQAARVLSGHGFATRPNWAFQDADEPSVSRELDVWSYKQILNDVESNLHVSVNVLVECKQSTTPYCAIGQELPEYRRIGNPTEHSLPVRFVPEKFDAQSGVLHYQYAWDAFEFREIAKRSGVSDFRATQLTRFERKDKGRWVASNSGIFSGLTYPLAKAVRACQRGIHTGDYVFEMPRKPLPEIAKERGSAGIILRFPVILISCPLYVVNAASEEPVVMNSDWVRLQRHLDSDLLKGIFEFDVVTREYFPRYIENQVLGMASGIAQAVSASPYRYTGEAADWWPPELSEGTNIFLKQRFPSSGFG